MLRLLLTVLLPLLAPFLIYFGWVWLSRRNAPGAAGTPESWREAPWIWLTAASVACGFAMLAYLHATTGYSPETKLAPPALVDGVVVPSHPVE